MKKVPYKIIIREGEWEVHFLSDARYRKQEGSDSGAITYTSEKRIVFNSHLFSVGIARHEVLHAFMAEASMESVELNRDQVEEVWASLVQHHYHQINYITEQIVNHFLKLRRLK